MVFETAAIIGGALALIAVQPPLYRLFPPKPKKTNWEEFWADAAVRHKHWDRCGVECTSPSSDIFDHIKSWNKPGTLAAAAETLRTEYVPQITKVLDNAGNHRSPREDTTWMDRGHEMHQRQLITEEAQRLGKQVYLDHATNTYRMKDKPAPLPEAPAFRLDLALLDEIEEKYGRQQQEPYWVPRSWADEDGLTLQQKPPISSADEDMLRAMNKQLQADGRESIDRGGWVDD
jgi:hypothetical protein